MKTYHFRIVEKRKNCYYIQRRGLFGWKDYEYVYGRVVWHDNYSYAKNRLFDIHDRLKFRPTTYLTYNFDVW